jgi:hypothetical protein
LRVALGYQDPNLLNILNTLAELKVISAKVSNIFVFMLIEEGLCELSRLKNGSLIALKLYEL